MSEGAATAALAGPRAPRISARSWMVVYLGVLYALVSLGDPSGSLISTPLSFFLKNKLHLSADSSATFWLLAGIPGYLGIVFGFARDTWSPFGLKDRGFLLLAGGASVALYAGFALLPPSYAALLTALILFGCVTPFLWAVLQGLTATMGEQLAAPGMFAAAWGIFGSVLGVVTSKAGGWFSERLEPLPPERALFMLYGVGGALLGCVALLGLIGILRPTGIYDAIRPERSGPARLKDELGRLLRHRPIYPALMIQLLFSFSPGLGTPLQYYFQDKLGGSDNDFGTYNAIGSAATIPACILLGWLARRVPLGRLLLWATVAIIPALVPLVLIGSVQGAYVMSAVMSLLNGFGTAAYTALLIRSCPPALQATTFALSGALTGIMGSLSNKLGAVLYDHGGFTACVVAMTIGNVLILPCLRLVPRPLKAEVDRVAPD